MFPFKILELEVLSFYLGGMPAGGSGDRNSTGWRTLESRRNSIKMFSREKRERGRGGLLGAQPIS